MRPQEFSLAEKRCLEKYQPYKVVSNKEIHACKVLKCTPGVTNTDHLKDAWLLARYKCKKVHIVDDAYVFMQVLLAHSEYEKNPTIMVIPDDPAP